MNFQNYTLSRSKRLRYIILSIRAYIIIPCTHLRAFDNQLDSPSAIFVSKKSHNSNRLDSVVKQNRLYTWEISRAEQNRRCESDRALHKDLGISSESTTARSITHPKRDLRRRLLDSVAKLFLLTKLYAQKNENYIRCRIGKLDYSLPASPRGATHSTLSKAIVSRIVAGINFRRKKKTSRLSSVTSRTLGPPED